MAVWNLGRYSRYGYLSNAEYGGESFAEALKVNRRSGYYTS